MKRTPETQHYVTYTVSHSLGAVSGSCAHSTPKQETEAVYAASMEAAVQQTHDLFHNPDLAGCAVPEVSDIRAAVGAELPWIACVVTVATYGEMVSTMPHPAHKSAAQALAYTAMLHDGAVVRLATPAEAEMYFRLRDIEDDNDADEEFDRGYAEAKEL